MRSRFKGSESVPEMDEGIKQAQIIIRRLCQDGRGTMKGDNFVYNVPGRDPYREVGMIVRGRIKSNLCRKPQLVKF